MRFKNRKEAAETLANMLAILPEKDWASLNPLVIALPRGGVTIGLAVAKHLGAEFDILPVKKLCTPQIPEYAIGALAEGGGAWLSPDAIQKLNVSLTELQALQKVQKKELELQCLRLRAQHPKQTVKGRIILLVDDGIATGATLLAAIASLKTQGIKKIYVAVPVASRDGLHLIEAIADAVYSAKRPSHFNSVEEWYENFEPFDDQEVIEALKTAQNEKLQPNAIEYTTVTIPLEKGLGTHELKLHGVIARPPHIKGWMLFAHGLGNSRKSPKTKEIAQVFEQAGFGTLLFDLYPPQEKIKNLNANDIPLLAHRLGQVTSWFLSRNEWQHLPIGYFASNADAAAALMATVQYFPQAFAIVSRDGQPELAWDFLKYVNAPTLLMVDSPNQNNERACKELPHGELALISKDSEQIAQLSLDWCLRALPQNRSRIHQNLGDIGSIKLLNDFNH